MTLDDIKDRLSRPTASWFLWPVYLTFIAALGIMIFAGWTWAIAHMSSDKAGQVVIATPSKEVAKQEVVNIPIKSVDVYKSGKTIKKKLNLPQPVVDDTKAEVLASSKIPSGERAHTVSTVINTDTGKSETYVRTDPLPWLAYENRGEIGLYYGIKSGERVTRLQARQDFIQAKTLHVGVVGSIDSDRQSFVGVGVAYRW